MAAYYGRRTENEAPAPAYGRAHKRLPIFVGLAWSSCCPRASCGVPYDVSEFHLSGFRSKGSPSLRIARAWIWMVLLLRPRRGERAGGSRSLCRILPSPRRSDVHAQMEQVAKMVRDAERPALVIGNQTMVGCDDPASLALAVEELGMPCWLGARKGQPAFCKQRVWHPR